MTDLVPVLNGKVAFVTGAGRGIGRGIAEVLAQSGADVAVNALTDRYVVDLCTRMAAETGRRVIPIVGDVTSSAGARTAVSSVINEFGHLDILVNALGESVHLPLVALPDQDGPGMADEDVEMTLNLNLAATIACTRMVGPHLLAQRSGKVINVSGLTAVRGGNGLVIYATAKTALTGFTRALALEWAPYNVQVNAVAPGRFPDPVTHGVDFEHERTLAAARTPSGRAGDMDEIGYLVRFLASSESDFITGQMIPIDGGVSLG